MTTRQWWQCAASPCPACKLHLNCLCHPCRQGWLKVSSLCWLLLAKKILKEVDAFIMIHSFSSALETQLCLGFNSIQCYLRQPKYNLDLESGGLSPKPGSTTCHLQHPWSLHLLPLHIHICKIGVREYELLFFFLLSQGCRVMGNRIYFSHVLLTKGLTVSVETPRSRLHKSLEMVWGTEQWLWISIGQ